ncbi:membrane protein insertase YidC [Lapidilactobacillus achengensis]|uniref:Membrane protein insertase YidC n=1 Tax=Lapidilactobacillus achengensis TaxID=2486000 RepID=A0ABW1US68_9LACO|nr:membrane protein insertase YidC [Lapidilactobacillus achengensis]
MKNKRQVLQLGGLSAALLLLLSGCANAATYTNAKPPSSGLYGLIYKYLATPMQSMIQWFGDLIGGSNSFGWGVILITLAVQLILLPLRLNQMQKSTKQTEKMKAVKPQIDLIQSYRSKATQAEAAQLSQLTMKVYQENHLSMTGGMGCLPLLLQLPIMAGLYEAVQFSPEIAKATFFGISLGQRSILIAVIATLLYAVQSGLSIVITPKEQRRQMMTMMIISPAMTFFISIVAPAGLGLYFFATAIIGVVQQLITNYVITPKIRREVDTDLKEHPIVTVVSEATFADWRVNQSQTAPEVQASHESNRARNAGKQQRRNDSSDGDRD